MKTIKIILICILGGLISGCSTGNLDTGTVLLLTQRLDNLESKKKELSEPKEEQRVEIEVYSNENSIDNIVNLNGSLGSPKKFKIWVIIDSNGNFIIPADRIVKRYELKMDK